MTVLVLEAGPPDTDPRIHQPSLVPRAAGLGPRLEVRDRGGAPTRRAPHSLAPGPGLGRQREHHRDRVRAGPPRGLRRVGGAREPRLGLGGGPALVQEGGEPRAGAVRAPRHRRAPERGRPPVGARRSRSRSWPPPSRPGSAGTTTSTARPRTAPPSTPSTRGTERGTAPPTPTCVRPSAGRTSPSRATRSRPGC